ncbi:uncharacterized protein LOC122335205 isoform X3 [Puntigrus tetrazona]|uniref:uncharacterized protein LOC122335205 isoform X2 n=1 Tax=Puntigrus tetrazona TaxID=1606681 RepID=UPI001C8955AA|nr:uncharacterized protein LOC122335205 isoform X2 [Puntigrus tetrazona]XP_043088948.1 uncharacterized protein LOC122335205 isoform X3 [Puntigrus tetrazona]
MFFSLLLLFGLFYHSHSGNLNLPVTGKREGNLTLLCEFEAKKILQVDLFIESGTINICQTEGCSERVSKTAACDVIIKNLSFSDAGKHTLRVYYSNDQTNLAQIKDKIYQIHIHDEITVKTGKPIKLHVLMSNAHKVEKNSSEGWKKVWEKGHGLWSDRMNVSEEDLIIKAFTDNDAGTYRVLDAEDETLITVNITESDTKLKGKLDKDEDKTDDTKEHGIWIWPVVVCSLILVLIGIGFFIWRCLHRSKTQKGINNKPWDLEDRGFAHLPLHPSYGPGPLMSAKNSSFNTSITYLSKTHF